MGLLDSLFGKKEAQTGHFKLICFCGEEKIIYYPISDTKIIERQLEWIMDHLIEHNGMYYNRPFSTRVKIHIPQDKSD